MTDQSLNNKIGQLFMIGLQGTTLDDITRQRIHDLGIGSIILFSKNTPDPTTTNALTKALHEESIKKHQCPMLIAIDQEQGRVMRIEKGMTCFPGQYALGKINQTEMTRKVAQITGLELKALGINLNLSPVADINNNPLNPIIGSRSFGEDPRLVSTMVNETIAGFFDVGMLSCTKHFPGHGDVTIDSHLDLPVIHKSLQELMENELMPFQSSIQNNVPMIITAHILFPAIDSEYPATASKIIINQILREDMGHQGVIISDDIEMKALCAHYPMPDLVIDIINAGCDMIIFSENMKSGLVFEDIYHTVYDAVISGKISSERLEQAVDRIKHLKKQMVSMASIGDSRTINHSAHQSFSHTVTQNAFKTNPDAKHFPISLHQQHIALISDHHPLISHFSHPHIHSLYLTDKTKPYDIHKLIDKMNEIWMFISSYKNYLILQQTLQSLAIPLRVFSLNDPYMNQKMQIECDSYINLFTTRVPIESLISLLVSV